MSTQPKGQLLWEAASSGDVRLVKELLALPSEQIDINWEDPEVKRTPFYRACYFGHADIVRCFLADPRTLVSHQQGQGATGLYIACFDGYSEIVRLILNDSRVNVNLEREDGTTAFFVACQEGKTEVVKMLLEDKRTNVNKPRDDSIAPVWIAAQNGHMEIIKWMIVSGREIDFCAKSSQGLHSWNERTPASQARVMGHKDISDLLDEVAKHPELVLWSIQKEFKILDAKSGELFALMVFLCDDYVRLRPLAQEDSEDTRNARRFFKIASRLHMDVQVVLSRRMLGLGGELIPSHFRENAFRALVSAMQPGP